MGDVLLELRDNGVAVVTHDAQHRRSSLTIGMSHELLEICAATDADGADRARSAGGFLPLGAHPGGGHFTLVSRKAGPRTAAALALFGQGFVGPECATAGLAFASFRVRARPGLAQSVANRVEHVAQMWSSRRGQAVNRTATTGRPTTTGSGDTSG